MSRKVFVTDDMGLDEALIDIATKSPSSAMLWPWIVPYFDDWGRADATPRRIKGKVFPLFAHITETDIQTALEMFAEAGIITLYEADGRRYMCVDPDKWFSYQTHIHKGKRSKDGSRIPACPLYVSEKSAQSRETPRDSAQFRASPSPSPSPSPTPTTPTPKPPRSLATPAAGEPVVAPSAGGGGFSVENCLRECDSDPARAHWRSALEKATLAAAPRTPDSWQRSVLLRWLDGNGTPPPPGASRASPGEPPQPRVPKVRFDPKTGLASPISRPGERPH